MIGFAFRLMINGDMHENQNNNHGKTAVRCSYRTAIEVCLTSNLKFQLINLATVYG